MLRKTHHMTQAEKTFLKLKLFHKTLETALVSTICLIPSNEQQQYPIERGEKSMEKIPSAMQLG